jgi:glutamyl-tRNA synthetase
VAASTTPARTRFAPSPTGFLHIGSFRTALFAWLLARHTGGQFLLRIEDTDQTRKVEGSIEYTMESLRWLGLEWDEGPDKGGKFGPYQQSERLGIYVKHAAWLVEHGHAYTCYCSPQRLEALRKEQEARKQPTGYDRRCRFLTDAERKAQEDAGIKPVIRFAAPLEGETTFTDYVRGPITVKNSTLDDMVLLKSDGFPTYNFANIVDDHLMQITHVLRGEEFLPSTPRYTQVYRAFGWEDPIYVHVGLVLAPDRSKLSKRHGAEAVLAYREKGYLHEAITNYLALLGWSFDGEREMFTLDELVKVFSIDRISPSPSIFDMARLESMNALYIRNMPTAELVERAMPFLREGLGDAAETLDRDYAARVIALDQERLRTLGDIPQLTIFFFVDPTEYPAEMLLGKGLDRTRALRGLDTLTAALDKQDDWSHEALLATLDRIVNDEGFTRTKADGSIVPDRGPLFMMVRVALSGRKETPGLPEMLEVMGRERVLRRLALAKRKLSE